MVFDIEPQTGSHTMKTCVVLSTAFPFLLLKKGSHIPVTHDGFRGPGFADGHIVLTGCQYGQEDLRNERCSAKTLVLDFLKEMIFFLQQVSIGISDVIDKEQQMSTRDRNTSRNCNSCFAQIYKR